MKLETRELIFDMDGTIADLYGIENWLEKLRAEDESPYRDAKPLYEMDILETILTMFKGLGFRIAVVSWASKHASKEYLKKIEQTKKEWLKKYHFPCDEIHIVPYGTEKADFIKDNFSVLIDDNNNVLESFLQSPNGNEKMVIDAKKNIVKQLIDLLLVS